MSVARRDLKGAGGKTPTRGTRIASEAVWSGRDCRASRSPMQPRVQAANAGTWGEESSRRSSCGDVDLRAHSLTVHGRPGAERTVPISEDAAALLRRHLAASPTGPLWRNRSGDRLSPRGAQYVCARAAHRAAFRRLRAGAAGHGVHADAGERRERGYGARASGSAFQRLNPMERPPDGSRRELRSPCAPDRQCCASFAGVFAEPTVGLYW